MPPSMGPGFLWGPWLVWEPQGRKPRPCLGGVGDGKGFPVRATP